VIRVLVADDQDLVREGLRLMLDAEPDIDVVAEARTGIEALAQTRRHDPDVVVMDVRMPELDGIEATARLARTGARARVLVLTTFDLDEYVYRALKAGASGFLLKDATREQLTTAVRTVSTGNALLAPAVVTRLVDEFCRVPPHDEALRQAAGLLSGRELEVLGLVAAGLSNAEVAAKLYLGEATVKSHVARVLAKLGLRDRVQLVAYAYETGILRPGDRA
jgi:DNA-binding NarL/FixJ family response regulator